MTYFSFESAGGGIIYWLLIDSEKFLIYRKFEKRQRFVTKM